MPDIAMCSGESEEGLLCSKRATCHRHTARPNGLRQSWLVISSLMLEQGCNYYWLVEEKKP